MKRLLFIIATHTAAVLFGIAIALIASHSDRQLVVPADTAVSYSIHVPTIEATNDPPEFHPLSEILTVDKTVQDLGGIVYHLDDLESDENRRFDVVVDFPGHTEIRAELQRLKAENRNLKILKKLQAEVKTLKRENQKLRKETDTQPAPAENAAP